MRLAAFIFIVAVLAVPLMSGCRKAEAPLSGGKPVNYWIESLSDPDPKQRKTAAFKLGNVGTTNAAVLPALAGALRDSDAGVRCEVILALVKCAPEAKQAIPGLAELQESDSDAKVREYAGKAVEKLKDAK